jgi:hypothetical protein
MAKRPSKRKSDNKKYTKKLRDLRKLGITNLPDARKLTKAQKVSITLKHARWGSLANNLHKIRKIKIKKGEKKLFKGSGYTVIGDSVFVPLAGYENARLRRNKGGLFIEKTQSKDGKVRKKYSERIGQRNDKLDWKTRLREEAEALNLKPGEYLGVRVYENGTFSVSGIVNYSVERAIKYLENDVHIKGSISKEKFLDNVSFVKLKFPRGIADMPPVKKATKRRRRK